jgi:hypothetical protein
MRIRFDSGGGVTGAAGRRNCEVDTEALPPGEKQEVLTLIQNADLRALAGRVMRHQGRPRPDETFYEITVEGDGGPLTVSATDRDMPTGLRPLINWLAHCAIRGK